jgi:hypothetical protein
MHPHVLYSAALLCIRVWELLQGWPDLQWVPTITNKAACISVAGNIWQGADGTADGDLRAVFTDKVVATRTVCLPGCEYELDPGKLCCDCPPCIASEQYFCSDRICTPVSVCEVQSKFQVAAATKSKDTECGDLTCCAKATQYQKSIPTPTNIATAYEINTKTCTRTASYNTDGIQCVNLFVCGNMATDMPDVSLSRQDGRPEEGIAACSDGVVPYVTQRRCTCRDQHYKDTATSTASLLNCLPCITCKLGVTYETKACTATQNRVCSPVTPSCGGVPSTARPLYLAALVCVAALTGG